MIHNKKTFILNPCHQIKPYLLTIRGHQSWHKELKNNQFSSVHAVDRMRDQYLGLAT